MDRVTGGVRGSGSSGSISGTGAVLGDSALKGLVVGDPRAGTLTQLGDASRPPTGAGAGDVSPKPAQAAENPADKYVVVFSETNECMAVVQKYINHMKYPPEKNQRAEEWVKMDINYTQPTRVVIYVDGSDIVAVHDRLLRVYERNDHANMTIQYLWKNALFDTDPVKYVIPRTIFDNDAHPRMLFKIDADPRNIVDVYIWTPTLRTGGLYKLNLVQSLSGRRVVSTEETHHLYCEALDIVKSKLSPQDSSKRLDVWRYTLGRNMPNLPDNTGMLVIDITYKRNVSQDSDHLYNDEVFLVNKWAERVTTVMLVDSKVSTSIKIGGKTANVNTILPAGFFVDTDPGPSASGIRAEPQTEYVTVYPSQYTERENVALETAAVAAQIVITRSWVDMNIGNSQSVERAVSETQKDIESAVDQVKAVPVRGDDADEVTDADCIQIFKLKVDTLLLELRPDDHQTVAYLRSMLQKRDYGAIICTGLAKGKLKRTRERIERTAANYFRIRLKKAKDISAKVTALMEETHYLKKYKDELIRLVKDEKDQTVRIFLIQSLKEEAARGRKLASEDQAVTEARKRFEQMRTSALRESKSLIKKGGMENLALKGGASDGEAARNLRASLPSLFSTKLNEAALSEEDQGKIRPMIGKELDGIVTRLLAKETTSETQIGSEVDRVFTVVLERMKKEKQELQVEQKRLDDLKKELTGLKTEIIIRGTGSRYSEVLSVGKLGVASKLKDHAELKIVHKKQEAERREAERREAERKEAERAKQEAEQRAASEAQLAEVAEGGGILAGVVGAISGLIVGKKEPADASTVNAPQNAYVLVKKPQGHMAATPVTADGIVTQYNLTDKDAKKNIIPGGYEVRVVHTYAEIEKIDEPEAIIVIADKEEGNKMVLRERFLPICKCIYINNEVSMDARNRLTKNGYDADSASITTSLKVPGGGAAKITYRKHNFKAISVIWYTKTGCDDKVGKKRMDFTKALLTEVCNESRPLIIRELANAQSAENKGGKKADKTKQKKQPQSDEDLRAPGYLIAYCDEPTAEFTASLNNLGPRRVIILGPLSDGSDALKEIIRSLGSYERVGSYGITEKTLDLAPMLKVKGKSLVWYNFRRNEPSLSRFGTSRAAARDVMRRFV